MCIKKRGGFTLVELVVVIAVLGILAGIAIPRFMTQMELARKETCLANRTTLAKELAVVEAAGGNPQAYFKEQINTVSKSTESRFHCPSNGVYTLAKDNIGVSCSLAEHANNDGAETNKPVSVTDPGADKNYIYGGAVEYEPNKKYNFGDLVVKDGIIYKVMNADKSAATNPWDYTAEAHDTWFVAGTADGSPIEWENKPYLHYELGTIVTYGGENYMFAPIYNDGRYDYSSTGPTDTDAWLPMNSNPKPVKPTAGIGTDNGYNAVDVAYKYTDATYQTGDKAWYRGQYYEAKKDFATTGNDASTTPSANSLYWQLAD